ncbi:MAG: hypothetical protein M1834_002726 [Cirrosporium novae-zelandiae]|nr:MAG: hypothetical protein M1834_002726 [Cirrosporium novae-zelandiae]
MSGQLVLSDGTGKVISKRKDHQKYAVKVTCLEEEGEWVSIATAGWDGKVNFYRSRFQGWQNGPAATASASGEEQYLPKLDEPLATLTMQSNPEAITLLHHPKTGRTLLLASRRDSTFIYTYALNRPSSDSEPSGGEQSQQNYRFELIHKQNLAPHSNAWIAFTPASFAISPVDPTLLAVATSTVPRMKVIIVRLLLDSKDAQTRLSEATLPPTPASLAHAERAIQEEEEAAIITHASAMAPQTAYSTPHVCWRPDGSGVWVNGDDGAVRGIEARTGKIMKILKEGHNAGSKVRSIFAGWVDVAGGGRNEEVLVSGGFDRRLVVWRVQELS